jgi:hypothetical protein
MLVMLTERLPFHLSKWCVLTHIIPFPGSVLPSLAINTPSPLYTLRVLMFDSLTRLYSSDACRKPRYRTRYTVRHILSLHAMASLTVCSSFVLADTDRLHNKITGMSARIRQLEDALEVSHSMTSSDTHPLLQRDLRQIKSIIDLHSAIEQANEDEGMVEHDDSRVLDTFGTLALRDDGASTFYGRSAGHEVRTLLWMCISNVNPNDAQPRASF